MSEIKRAQRQFEMARARLQKAKASMRGKERKKDTRRKIILGGMMIAAARNNLNDAMRLKTMIAQLSGRDRAAFEGWDLTGEGK